VHEMGQKVWKLAQKQCENWFRSSMTFGMKILAKNNENDLQNVHESLTDLDQLLIALYHSKEGDFQHMNWPKGLQNFLKMLTQWKLLFISILFSLKD